MKATMSVSVEKDIKDQFSNFAKSIGSNPTNLLNMFMVETINTGEIRFKRNYLEMEFDSFSQQQGESLVSKGGDTSTSIFATLDTHLGK